MGRKVILVGDRESLLLTLKKRNLPRFVSCLQLRSGSCCYRMLATFSSTTTTKKKIPSRGVYFLLCRVCGHLLCCCEIHILFLPLND